MNEDQAAPEHVVGRAKIPVEFDLSVLEQQFKTIEMAFDQMVERFKGKISAAFDLARFGEAQARTDRTEPEASEHAGPPEIGDDTERMARDGFDRTILNDIQDAVLKIQITLDGMSAEGQ